MFSKTRIIIADDQKLFVEVLGNVLNAESDLEVVATAENGEELLIKLNSYNADVLLLDLEMPKMSGLEVLPILRDKWPDLKTIVLSMYASKPFIRQSYDYGALGYLLKNSDLKALSKAIRSVVKGEPHYKGEVLDVLMRDNTSKRTIQNAPLTKRETQILILISREFSNPEIAEKLHLSTETVNTHRKNILQKIGVKNTAGLVKYALRQGLIE